MAEENTTLKKFEIFYPGHDETVELGQMSIKLGEVSRIVYNEIDRKIEVFYDERKKKTVYNLDKGHYYNIWMVD
jgi:hypothetical protein